MAILSVEISWWKWRVSFESDILELDLTGPSCPSQSAGPLAASGLFFQLPPASTVDHLPEGLHLLSQFLSLGPGSPVVSHAHTVDAVPEQGCVCLGDGPSREAEVPEEEARSLVYLVGQLRRSPELFSCLSVCHDRGQFALDHAELEFLRQRARVVCLTVATCT